MVMETGFQARELWQEVEEGAAPIVREIRSEITDTARRIKSKIPSAWKDIPAYLKPFVSVDFFEPEVYITDRPEKVFGENETIYTITSTLALENPENDTVLHPPSEHSHYDKNIKTHRGIGLELFSRLMNQFGFSLGAKDGFVWLGPHVDGEQFILEDNIARDGKKVDIAIADHLFNQSDVKKQYSRLEINPHLRKLIESINEGNSLYGKDQQTTEYAEKLLTTLHRYTGVREGWFNSLEGLLKGTIPVKKKIDPFNLDESLTYAAHRLSQPVPKSSRAALLEIDTGKLLQATPIYPFPISSRPPEAIVPAPHVPFAAVKGVYLEDQTDLDLLKRYRHLIKPIDELPIHQWLADINGNHITPTIARRQGVDPRNPICALRYNRSPIDVWAGQLRDGNIAPLSEIPDLDLITPTKFTDYSIRKLILDRARSSGLLSKIVAITKDQFRAEQRILGEAMRLRLPSVRHV